MAEKNSQGKHHIRIALFVPAMLIIIIGVVWYGVHSRSFTVAGEPGKQAKNSLQMHPLPDDLVVVGDAKYASLEGLAPGSQEAQERQRRAVQQLGLHLEVKTRKTGIVFRLVPAGSFSMGSPSSESGRRDDETPHQVTLSKAFYCGKFEVTQEQWEAVMGSNPSVFSNGSADMRAENVSSLKAVSVESPPDHASADTPVENVSWEECQVFVKNLCQLEGVSEGTYRLLTEAEWEYTCRAGTVGPRAGDIGVMAWYTGNSREKTHPVGQKNANGFGLHDMYGNVREWCQDWYGSYPSGSVIDPSGPSSGVVREIFKGYSSPVRVLRGGCWYFDAMDFRSAQRAYWAPGIRFDSLSVGLRLARIAPSRVKENTSRSDASDYKNLDELVDKVAHTKFDFAAANREPPDIDPKAKELKDIGMALFNKENRFQEGIEKIEAALKIDPRMPDAYGTLALYFAIKKEDPRTAVRHLEEGIKNCPKSSLVRINLGNVYAQMNQPKKAIEQFKTALDLGVEAKAPVFYNIGNAYIALDKKADAISYYREALAEDENHLNVRRNLVIALVETGDRRGARQEAQRLLELDPNGESGNWARQALQHIDSL